MGRHIPEITVIGGGTGNYTLLNELKHYPVDINAVVSMSDDGGSTGVLRDEYGILPPGDINQCATALSGSEAVQRFLRYRFSSGPFKSHTGGNMAYAAFQLFHDYSEEALRDFLELAQVRGNIIPVTTDRHVLLLDDGPETIRFEKTIDDHTISHPAQTRIRHDPVTQLHPEALEAIERSDMVVLTAGSVYTSRYSALAVNGMQSALQATRAKKIIIANLVNKPGQTDGWHAVDYAAGAEQYIGEGTIDHLLFNTEPFDHEVLSRYMEDGEKPVNISVERFKEIRARPIGAPLVASAAVLRDPNDKTPVKRSFIRHDGAKLSELLLEIHYESKTRSSSP